MTSTLLQINALLVTEPSDRPLLYAKVRANTLFPEEGTRVGSITFGTDREGNMNDRSEEEESK